MPAHFDDLPSLTLQIPPPWPPLLKERAADLRVDPCRNRLLCAYCVIELRTAFRGDPAPVCEVPPADVDSQAGTHCNS